jgi:RNA 2',3'-cyclic 3'-phosphodiesterase
VRLFLAINLPSDVRREIVAATAPVRDAAPELSWVDESKLHLTLKFLGEQSSETAAAVRDATARVAAGHREIVMRLSKVGAFPNFRRSRVVWLGVEPDPRLELLHHDVEVACQALGFEVEGRPFRPHLTLARVKQRLPEERARALSRAARRVEYSADVVVRSLDLMRSELGSSASSYSTLGSAPLRSD